jgi:hypothetical protein
MALADRFNPTSGFLCRWRNDFRLQEKGAVTPREGVRPSKKESGKQDEIGLYVFIVHRIPALGTGLLRTDGHVSGDY